MYTFAMKNNIIHKMKTVNKIFAMCVLSLLISACGNNSVEEEYYDPAKTKAKQEAISAEKTGPDLKNKGIGPISSVTLDAEVNSDLVKEGADIFKAKCSACHKPDKKFIGPSPAGILERRSPEWVMNMILNPDEMISKDPIAKQLLIDFNGAPMANQNLKEEEARAVLEYFRTLK